MSINRIASKAVLAVMALVLAGLAAPAAAQQMGREPYNGSSLRNPSLAAQFAFQQRMRASGAESTAAGLGALNQFVTTYNSSSTSIANMNQVNQNLSGGSSGSVGQSTDQASHGNQTSEAETQTKIDNAIKILEEAQQSAQDSQTPAN